MKILTTKNVLTLIGAIALLQGIGFFFGAEAITKGSFLNLNQGDALRVGTLMHEALAGSLIAVGIIILSARNLEESAAKKILNGIGVAYLVFFAVAMKHFLGGEVQPPIPALVLLVVCSLLAFYTANKKTA
jgi:CHASE2 domain-containing sensor protein